MHLARAFLTALASRPEPLPDEGELEEILVGLLRASQGVWPEVEVAPEAFVHHLAERVPAEISLREALETLHASDLYLACGCLLENTKALAHFDASFISRISSVAGREDGELAQGLRVRMLLGADGQ